MVAIELYSATLRVMPFPTASVVSDMSQYRTPELPGLTPGVQLVASEQRVGDPLRTLTLDHVLMEDGLAYWIDSHGHAVAQALAEVAPDPRVLDRIHVARGFTGYQHASLVETLGRTLAEEVSVIVLPAIDAMYREDDHTPAQAREFLLRTLARVARLAREYDIPILVSRERDDHLGELVANLADRRICYRETAFGPKFSGPDFETHVYPVGNGIVQTTFAFWQQVVAEREPLHAASHSNREEVSIHGAH